ncbi:hypothetical protein FGF1_03860 [Flavobacteriaceae bacterium GF1]
MDTKVRKTGIKPINLVDNVLSPKQFHYTDMCEDHEGGQRLLTYYGNVDLFPTDWENEDKLHFTANIFYQAIYKCDDRVGEELEIRKITAFMSDSTEISLTKKEDALAEKLIDNALIF